MYNVLIRPLVESDALLSWKWRNDSELWQFTGTRPDQFITFQIEKEWIEKVLSDNTSRRFAILADDEYVGNIQLTNIEENKTAEYHIFIGNKNYWGKGIASLATKQIIRYATKVLHLEELYLRVNPDNVAAIKVYEKCNFKKINEDITMSLNLFDVKVPKVSVFMMVYNHEKYIEEALNGVLMQKCNFDYEIVVGEDCSNDDSRSILLEYFKKFPGKFKLLLHNSNIGAQKNQLTVLENCTGQYIAMCEGDDYWTDPLKLQKQVDFLEANSDYVIHSGNATQLTDDIKLNGKAILNNQFDRTFQLTDFLSNNNIITCTTMFRNIEFIFPENFNRVTFGDWFLYIILLNNSGLKVYRSIDLYSVYRVHKGGVMSNLSELENCSAHILQILIINNYLKNQKLEGKQLVDLNNYSLQKYRIQINNKLYYKALKTAATHFKYAGSEMPFKKYFNTLKHHLTQN